jgi:hypothetical protein
VRSASSSSFAVSTILSSRLLPMNHPVP